MIMPRKVAEVSIVSRAASKLRKATRERERLSVVWDEEDSMYFCKVEGHFEIFEMLSRSP